MKVKILVAYHKKAPLYKNEVLVPIHVGRAVAKEKSKDGIISDGDLQWLMTHMIGDDAGDNISHLNRIYAELTAIYWAWKNYDKLGNPDIIGLMHYRRFLQLEECPPPEKDVLSAMGYNTKCISKLMRDVDVVARIEEPIVDPSITFFDCFQCLAKFSEQHYPELYKSYQDFIKEQKMHWGNMFIMKKEVFFDYCQTIFSILQPYAENKNLDQTLEFKNFVKITVERSQDKQTTYNNICDETGHIQPSFRLFGFMGEYLTSFYMDALVRNGKKVIGKPNLSLENMEATKQNLFKRTLHIGPFVIFWKKKDGIKRVLYLFGIPFFVYKSYPKSKKEKK